MVGMLATNSDSLEGVELTSGAAPWRFQVDGDAPIHVGETGTRTHNCHRCVCAAS